MEDFKTIACNIFIIWLTLVIVLILLPSMFGSSLGISEVYMKILVKVLEWATLRIQKGFKDKEKLSASNGIIQRDKSPMETEIECLRQSRSQDIREGDFELGDVFYFAKKGFEAIVEDEVTQRFSSEELISWNLLTRTNNNFHYVSLRVTLIWVLGLCVRYCILLPLRITLATIGISWLVLGATLVGQLPNSRMKSWFSELVHLMCCRICARALSSAIQYHNKENKPKKGGICVANHTSPIDIIILANDGCYAMVGQVHGGLMGIIQRAMARACPHVWFERSEMRDRHLVTERLREHVSDKSKLPILIFPEGTCINNTSVMMFKKGSFEIGGTIYPVAIKYDPQFGDAFWNSSKNSMVSYLLRMMTSWALKCNVWYLPPVNRQDGEDAVQFANRVKSAIAKQGGLVELPWDGGLKRGKVKDSFKEEQQKNYSRIIAGENKSLKPTTH
ncbi:glycerol-3-phosphate acyltransferase 3 [Xenopus laevis]|uniref:Glycerol-3-phosphate acyltransferase 3 n=1 Tax=Xenopus laevis TaxID=8355 RepID=GPAT3_XENLA|nr:glycerol-3-phosphate acyltransferase 3 [Xenopus laevis]Q68F37.1 RecName: Full=Glycerol-3-phosphate acyltransferase 3; Short=GPAT-3; AltName: Full=1-acyl-sn-glycerol-3-phosphate O-acyltransferase 10; Short=AGPAT 10; AltName: Full=1-acyl-sn-glycerol-3-phosphate O-acyltransferase 9; Short=1-AGP acyltransferase 9; Short=1-AGPAT 9; AltName: Full=Lysophosphatidic acid acyltransferase theta; Short=LPAAT-theta [Xenopus laevis]AAH80008.1 MGC81856 protein [Xenopus laevis]